MAIGSNLVIFAGIIAIAESYCYRQTRTAYLSSNTYSVSYPVSNQYCSIYIQPVWYYSSYYLKISWSSSDFDMKADMPDCKENYIEVYLTRNYTSIGRYCSNNAGHPFTMYSWDGYARIDYRTSRYATNRGFKFTYNLESKTSDYLGTSAWTTTCANTRNYASSGVIYSSGWPYRYSSTSSPCVYKIYKTYNARGIRVVFMDVDVYQIGYYDECVRLSASNYSSDYYYSSISPRKCNRNYTAMFNTYSNYLKITFNRNRDGSPYRGFVAGYISFLSHGYTSIPQTPGTPRVVTPAVNIYHKSVSDRLSPVTIGIIMGTVIPSIVIIIAIIITVVYCQLRNRQNSAQNLATQTGNTSLLTTPQYTGRQQTMQNGSSIAYANGSFFMQVGRSLSYPCSTSYPASQPDSTSQHNGQGNAPSQFTFTVAASHNPSSPGALVPSSHQMQSSDASAPYPVISSASCSYNPGAIAPIGASCDKPPPPYSSAM